MIGIILWGIVIFIIVIYACPGFLPFLFFVCFPVAIGTYILFSLIGNAIPKWWKRRKKYVMKEQDAIRAEKRRQREREKANRYRENI